CPPGAVGATPPGNLSGPRTAEGRRLWKAASRRPPTVQADDICGISQVRYRAGGTRIRVHREVPSKGVPMTPPTVQTSTGPVPRALVDDLAVVDPDVAAAIDRELARQRDGLEMIASENHTA